MAINIETQKENLLKEKDMLIRQLSGLGLYDPLTNTFTAEADTVEKNNVHDMDEDADIFESFETNSATGGILQERLTDVQDALTKIENNTYGICEVMNTPIEEDRLIANPAARTCKQAMNQE